MATHTLVEDGTTLILTPASTAHTASVIIMHGLGDSAAGWIDTAADVFAPALPHVKFTLPTATVQPVSVNGGARMPAWYDIEGFGIDRKLRKYSGIEDSAARIRGLIKAEVEAGIPTNRIALAGFSQGGAMSLYTGLTHAETLGGIIAISGHLPLQEMVAPPAAALATPVFQGHGDNDAVVRLDWAQADQARMGELGVTDHALKVYGGVGHTTCPEELRDIIAFLTRVLPAAPAVAAEAASAAGAAATGAGATVAASGGAAAAPAAAGGTGTP